MASTLSPSEGQLIPHSEVESQLSSLLFGTHSLSLSLSLSLYIYIYVMYNIHMINLSQQVQVAMENMLKMTNEIDENSSGITEEIAKCKDNAFERKKILEEQKESFQKAAFTVLDLLNNKDIG
ncbi:hypothetical protein LOK49_LG11G01632 [Camellia lanceoleosa]|uniref:Uncharacterized protein n=1 Tax=Camellia lanceoleosa TaxID=1840588 RepID=A0ACC0G1J7_9ERIC|nr:hypothetical protein LOK49_LG11G01632 [Camellia lanceoleosa]